MSQKMRNSIGILLVLCLLLLGNHMVLAQEVTLDMKVSPTVITVGDTIIVSLSITSSEDVGSIQGALEYDSSKLRYQSGNSNAFLFQNGKGQWNDFFQGSVKNLTYTLEFQTIEAGEAMIAIKQSEMIGAQSGAVLGTPTSKILVTIKKQESVEVETPEEPDQQEVDAKDPYVADILLSQAELVLIPGAATPKGYNLQTMEMQGVGVEAFVADNGEILFYGISRQGNTGYFRYDPLEETVQRVLIKQIFLKEDQLEGHDSMEAKSKMVLFLLVWIVLCVVLLLSLIHYRKNIETFTNSKK